MKDLLLQGFTRICHPEEKVIKFSVYYDEVRRNANTFEVELMLQFD